MVRRALHPLSERARVVHGPRTVADGLPAGLRRVGGDCRDRLSAGVRVHLTAFADVALAASMSEATDRMTPTREVVRPAPVQTTQNHSSVSALRRTYLCPVHKKAALHRTGAMRTSMRRPPLSRLTLL